jgi:hypothetical protein
MVFSFLEKHFTFSISKTLLILLSNDILFKVSYDENIRYCLVEIDENNSLQFYFSSKGSNNSSSKTYTKIFLK